MGKRFLCYTNPVLVISEHHSLPHLLSFFTNWGYKSYFILFYYNLLINTQNFQPSLLKVGRGGLAPPVFLVWQIYSLLASLLAHLPKLKGFHTVKPFKTALVYIYCQSAAAHSLNGSIHALFKRHSREFYFFCDNFRLSHNWGSGNRTHTRGVKVLCLTVWLYPNH